MRRQAAFRRALPGVTLVELLVVLVVVAILATLAVPAFSGLIASAAVSQAVNSFVSDARFARGEGMRRGRSVTLCRTASSSAAKPICSGGDGAATGAWMEGWVVFVDHNANGLFDGADKVLRVQGGLSGLAGFLAVSATASPLATQNRITFDADGRAIGQQGRWLVRPSGWRTSDDSATRTLCMNAVGRVRVAKNEVVCQ